MCKSIVSTLVIFCFAFPGCSPNEYQNQPKNDSQDQTNNTLINGHEIPPNINELQSLSGAFTAIKPIEHFEIPETNWKDALQEFKKAKRSKRVEKGHKPEALVKLRYKMKNGFSGLVYVFNLDMDKPFVFTVYDLDVWDNFEHPKMTLKELVKKLEPLVTPTSE